MMRIIEDVLLGPLSCVLHSRHSDSCPSPAVTALAKSSGVHCVPRQLLHALLYHLHPCRRQPSNRRASLHRYVTHAQWFRYSSKNAANRGYATDAANVFNVKGLKANYAFMPSPLIPQPPLTKGTSAAIQHNVKELCAVVLASRRPIVNSNVGPRTLSRLRIIYIMCKCPQPPRCGFKAAASRKGCLTIALLTPGPPTCWSTKGGSSQQSCLTFPPLAAHHPVRPQGLPKFRWVGLCLLLVFQYATVLNLSRLNHASVAQATLTGLRAVTLRND